VPSWLSVSSSEGVHSDRPQRKDHLMSPRKRSAARAKSGELVCPECGKTFTRPASLGAHRNRAHGVAGSSKAVSTRGKRAARAGKRSAARPGGASTSGVRSKRAASSRKTAATQTATRTSNAGSTGTRRVRRSSLDRACMYSPVPGRPPRRSSRTAEGRNVASVGPGEMAWFCAPSAGSKLRSVRHFVHTAQSLAQAGRTDIAYLLDFSRWAGQGSNLRPWD
jgi:uncharacterized C2H2 Zn-finger protein